MDTGKLIVGAGALAAAGAGIWYATKKSTDTSTIPGTVADEFIPQMEEPSSTYLYVPDTGEVIKPIVAEQEYSDAPSQSYVSEEQIARASVPTTTAQSGKTPVDPSVMVRMITALYRIQDEKKRKAAAMQMSAALRSLSVADQRVVLARTITWYNALPMDRKHEVIKLFESIGLQSWASKLKAAMGSSIERAEGIQKDQADTVAKQVLIERAKSDYQSEKIKEFKEQQAILQKQAQNQKEAEYAAALKQQVADRQAEVASADNNKQTPLVRVAVPTTPAAPSVTRAPMQLATPATVTRASTFSAPTRVKPSFVSKVVRAVNPQPAPAATITRAPATVKRIAAPVTRTTVPTTTAAPVNSANEMAAFNVLRAMFNALPVTANEKFQYVRVKAAYDAVVRLPIASQKKVISGYAKWFRAQPVAKRRAVTAIIQKIAGKYPYLRKLAA